MKVVCIDSNEKRCPEYCVHKYPHEHEVFWASNNVSCMRFQSCYTIAKETCCEPCEGDE